VYWINSSLSHGSFSPYLIGHVPNLHCFDCYYISLCIWFFRPVSITFDGPGSHRLYETSSLISKLTSKNVTSQTSVSCGIMDFLVEGVQKCYHIFLNTNDAVLIFFSCFTCNYIEVCFLIQNMKINTAQIQITFLLYCNTYCLVSQFQSRKFLMDSRGTNNNLLQFVNDARQ
jgi:hypothetical protein